LIVAEDPHPVDALEGGVTVTQENDKTKLSLKGKYKISNIKWLEGIGGVLEYDSSTDKWTGGGQADIVFGKHWKLEGKLTSDGNSTAVGMTLVFRYE
jgi:hypothetical protein